MHTNHSMRTTRECRGDSVPALQHPIVEEAILAFRGQHVCARNNMLGLSTFGSLSVRSPHFAILSQGLPLRDLIIENISFGLLPAVTAFPEEKRVKYPSDERIVRSFLCRIASALAHDQLHQRRPAMLTGQSLKIFSIRVLGLEHEGRRRAIGQALLNHEFLRAKAADSVEYAVDESIWRRALSEVSNRRSAIDATKLGDSKAPPRVAYLGAHAFDLERIRAQLPKEAPLPFRVSIPDPSELRSSRASPLREAIRRVVEKANGRLLRAEEIAACLELSSPPEGEDWRKFLILVRRVCTMSSYGPKARFEEVVVKAHPAYRCWGLRKAYQKNSPT